MKVWRPSSLQWRLTLSLLVVTGLVWTLVLVMTWLKTEHELSELLDAHLAQTAAVLAVQTSDEHDDDFTTAPVLHKYQPRVAFQVWHEKKLVFRSAEPLCRRWHLGAKPASPTSGSVTKPGVSLPPPGASAMFRSWWPSCNRPATTS